DRAHGVLADAEVEIAVFERVQIGRTILSAFWTLDAAGVLDQRVRRRREVGRAADDERCERGELLDDLSGNRTRRRRLIDLRRLDELLLESLGHRMRPVAVPLLGELRIARPPLRHPLLP